MYRGLTGEGFQTDGAQRTPLDFRQMPCSSTRKEAGTPEIITLVPKYQWLDYRIQSGPRCVHTAHDPSRRTRLQATYESTTDPPPCRPGKSNGMGHAPRPPDDATSPPVHHQSEQTQHLRWSRSYQPKAPNGDGEPSPDERQQATPPQNRNTPSSWHLPGLARWLTPGPSRTPSTPPHALRPQVPPPTTSPNPSRRLSLSNTSPHRPAAPTTYYK